MKYNKTEQKIVDLLEIGDHDEEITNPFSKATVVLPPLGVALHDYIKGCEMTSNWRYFDNARYLFAKLYPSEYMTLLD
jgi:hypothetical protein